MCIRDRSVSVRDAIVSSSHLASSAPELSEVEFGLIIASHAFNRWMVRCMACAGLPELTSLDILVLNHVFHRGRGKKLADICFTLNVDVYKRQRYGYAPPAARRDRRRAWPPAG